MRYWLFYAGPENYLSEQGERDFAQGEWEWSGVPEVSKGDLALLYRKSVTRISAKALVELVGMPIETAHELKRKGIGSDISVLWQVQSANRGPLAKWQASYIVRTLAKIEPPITLSELKATPALRKWEDVRWNFQAQGRDALEIPEFAWVILKNIVSARITVPIEQLTRKQ
jgi:predicted RNA-binding protein with PUA-like domain